jgi:hypothetical protein
VDSCTAIVEHADGRLELIEWGAPPAATLPALPMPEPTRVAESRETVKA